MILLDILFIVLHLIHDYILYLTLNDCYLVTEWPWVCHMCYNCTWFLTSTSTAPSAPPQDVQLLSLSSTSIKVSWVAPPAASRHGNIVRYSLAYQAPSGEDQERHEVTDIPADATSYVLQGLEKWTLYQVWVKAHTDVGPGPESSSTQILTQEDGTLS